MIVLFILLRQGIFLAAFFRQFAVGMQFLNALIPGICLRFEGRMNSNAALLEESEVMPSPFGLCGAENAFGFSLGNYLCFERVFLLLA